MPEKTFVLKLNDGSDIIASLEKLAKEKSIEYGLIVSGLGRIKDFELIYHEQKGSITRAKFDKPSELIAISGKIQVSKKGEFSANIRVSVTSGGFTPNAGQLVKGKALGQLEIGVRKVDFNKMIVA